jgi:hypothetical protein
MKRLHTAALAAFLLCACVGAARAYYFTNCTFTTSANNIGYNSTNKTFFAVSTGTCGGGDVACCVKISADLLYSADGMHFSALSHFEKTYDYACGPIVQNPRKDVAVPQSPAGWYRLTATIGDCSGNIIHNYGSVTQQVP